MHPRTTPLLAIVATIALLMFMGPGVKADQTDQTAGKVEKIEFATDMIRPYKAPAIERDVEIYLPVGYDDPENASKRYPVIYLLHGSPGKPLDFFKNGHWEQLMASYIRSSTLGPAIMVAPDGNYVGAAYGDSEWINSVDGKDRFEDFVVSQIVPWTDQNYRTLARADSRIIGGVSEGGFGAANIALHHPQVFGYVFALSGYYTNDGSGWARRIMGRDKDFLAYNSPTSLVEATQPGSKLLHDWQNVHFYIGSGNNEKRYSEESREFAAALQDKKIPVILNQIDGRHGWELWNALYVNSIDMLFPVETHTSDVAPGLSS